MHNLLRRVALIVAIAISTTTLPARAADDAASAREHYQKGTAFYDLGKYNEAIKEFEAAYEIKNDPALLYNLAQSHRLAGNAEQALHFYRTYLRRVPKAPNRAEIDERITALEQQVAQKNAAGVTPPPTTTPTTPPAGTVPPPETTAPSPTTPGGVTPLTPPPAPGPTAGASATVVVAPPPTTPADRARKLKLAGIVTAAAGGTLVIIGAIEGLRAVGAANEVNKAVVYDPAVQSRGLSAQHAEVALLIVGGLAAAAGGGLYYYGWRTERTAGTQVAVTPVASAQGAGALVRVTF
jgi:tetratricopeptide (TPR) repeat protein